MANDPAMKQAYLEGKDLYCVIAASMFNNNYEDNLEFYPAGTELEIDGKTIVAGNEKEALVELDTDNAIIVPYYYLVDTPKGYIQAMQLKPGDLVKSDHGDLAILKVERIDNNVKIYC